MEVAYLSTLLFLFMLPLSAYRRGSGRPSFASGEVGKARFIAGISLCLLAGCAERKTAVERVKQFCDGIVRGEQFAAVRERHGSFGLEVGGVPPELHVRAASVVPPEQLRGISGLLIEPARSGMNEARPVCAIYYLDTFKGGDGRVAFSEFIPSLTGRH
jgi:hypothetical protein